MIEQVRRIGELGRIYDGPHATPKKTEQGPFFLSISSLKNGSLHLEQSAHLSEADFERWTKRVTPKKDDLLFSYETRLGEAALMPGGIKACLGRRMALLRPNKQIIEPKFLLYSYLSPSFQSAIKANTITGATVDRIALNEFPDFPIWVPGIDEQKKISRVLSSLDEKIELNNRINEELESLAKLIYDYWFVQFDFPITAAQAAAMGDPTLEGKPYKSSGGPMTHNHQLNREIPEGWTANTPSSKALLNELEWNDRTAPNKVTYLDLSNAKSGKILGTNNYSWETAPSRAKRILRDGDTVIGTVRPGNRSYCLIGPSETQLTGSTGFAVFSPIDSIFREFTYLTLTSDHNIKRLATVASGASYPAVNSNVVGSHPMAFPSDELIEGFHRKTAPMFDLLLTNQKQNQELAALRDWLLPMLMNGQVTVQS
ncbi:restriction endonuclease subunit S [Roseibacillus persicicus]|uniref:restriction endonuclease subunit S n=1 Tax=Roseibacillus persicicus TaxID=454148 RepID=UPI00280DB3BD|nr:restriction endonuclease subunit S [Roseibacillus persicicus]MDQ8189540.1 restriction endonuclease subunit S [Roseibacillus persicicus]